MTDMERVRVMAELCTDTPADDAEIALDALAEVQPGGHFFGAAHTMDRYQTAFYDPLIHDWSNFGTWTERGARDASTRATEKWTQILAGFTSPVQDTDRLGGLQEFIARRTEAGGAPSES